MKPGSKAPRAQARNGNSYTSRYLVPPEDSAQSAGLRYATDQAPGITRKRSGGSFRYLRPDGKPVRDAQTLARIRSLAIPPAWQKVWISAYPDAHLQATGRDARGRKQYRYHPRWREFRDETKYHRTHAFGHALPRIRRQVCRDLALPALPRRKALATVLRLLETTFIRVGNEEYARDNESFGLTTLREKQVRVNGSTVKFQFRGKSGVEHRIALSDRQLAGILRRMIDLPGYELFKYIDEAGERRPIESADVNAYLKEIAGGDFTSKDFRTWAGTVLAARELSRLPAPASVAQAKRHVASAVDAVSHRLGNTRSVCKKCYIHPAIIETYTEGTLHGAMRGGSPERSVLRLLKRQAARDRDEARRSGAGEASLLPVLARSVGARRRARSAAPPGIRSSRKRPAAAASTAEAA